MRTFTVDEGKALMALKSLLRGENQFPKFEKIGSPQQDFLSLGAKILRRAFLQDLTLVGGYQDATFVREGVRVSGRIFDGTLNAGWHPSFGRISLRLWLDAGGLRGGEPPKLPKSAEPGAGDEFLISCVYEAVRRGGGNNAYEGSLRALSPYLTLRTPTSGLPDGMTLDGLFSPQGSRVVELRQRQLARVFTSTLANVVKSAGTGRFQAWRETAERVTAVLREFLLAAVRARRADTLAPLAESFATLYRDSIPGTGAELREKLTSYEYDKLENRDATIAAATGLLGIATDLLKLRADMADVRFDDPRYVMAQRFLRIMDDSLTPLRARHGEILRVVSGSVG